MQRSRLSSTVMVAALMLTACTSGEDGPATDGTDAATPTGGAPSSEPAPASESPSDPTPSSEEPADPTVQVRIIGERVTPNAEEVALSVGDRLVFEIVSDRPGKLHVHSKPEQYVEFGEGSTRAEISIKTPGSVEVEEHDTSAVVAIVEVR